MISQRSLAVTAAVAAALTGAAQAAQSPQVPLPGSAIPQFVSQLPTLAVWPGPGTPNKSIQTVVDNGSQLTFNMCEFDANMLPVGTPVNMPVAGLPPTTKVWGYIDGTCPTAADTYIGPVVVATRDQPTEINYVNDLGYTDTSDVLAYTYSTDLTLHWADPLGTNPAGGDPLDPESNACNHMGGVPAYGSPCAQNYNGPIPAVPHLHGAEDPPVVDGGPDAWFTSDGSVHGHAYYTMPGGGAASNAAIYRYPNSQEAAPIWFHDHTLGATRLNVYAGLAGAYFIQDKGNPPPATLQALTEVIPLVLQDRMFDTNGQLLFPADSLGGVLWTPNPDHPYWVPEFVGDTIAVNGKVWPFVNLEAKRYRFLLLNGSNARTYQLFLPMPGGGNIPLYVISNDGGYLDAPVAVNKLTMMPGERYEVIIDFGGVPNTNLVLKNTGRTPFPKGAPPQGTTVGKIVQFRVGAAPGGGDPSYDPALGTPLRTNPIVRLTNPATGTLALGVTPAVTRELTLNEVLAPASTAMDPVTGVTTNYPGGPLEILVNNTKWDGKKPGGAIRSDFQPVTVGGVTEYYSELPEEGTTEEWDIVNLTADAHPIHTHLTDFQIMNRQNFNVNKYTAAYNLAFPGGLYIPAYGPPLDYAPTTPPGPSGTKYGGNPDVTPFLQGPVQPPGAYEAGWKDTVVAYPGQVTRIVVRYSPNDSPVVSPPDKSDPFPFDPNALGHGYVWHCHIIDHEDNEMMRPLQVQPDPSATRTYVQGTDY